MQIDWKRYKEDLQYRSEVLAQLDKQLEQQSSAGVPVKPYQSQVNDADKQHRAVTTIDAGQFINAALLPLSLMSPTSVGRRIYDTNQYLKGNLDKDNWIASLAGENNGMFSDEFTEEHPIITTIGNGVVDAASGVGLMRGLQAAKAAKLKTWYTGVPKRHRASFPDYDGTVWTSNNVDAARWYTEDRSNNGIYKVLVDESKLDLTRTPPPRRNNEYFQWNDLPFKWDKGKLTYNPRYRYRIRYGSKEYRVSMNDSYADDNYNLITDDIVNVSQMKGKDGVKFSNIKDGSLYSKDGTTYSRPIDELVLNPGTTSYRLPYSQSKYSLSFLDTMPANQIVNNLRYNPYQLSNTQK